MKKIVAYIMAFGLFSGIIMAGEINNQCLLSEKLSLDNDISVKFSEDQMKKTLFTFKQDTKTNILIDADGVVWHYKFTKDGIDYYTNDKKTYYFLIGSTEDGIKNVGIYDLKNKMVYKGYCKEKK